MLRTFFTACLVARMASGLSFISRSASATVSARSRSRGTARLISRARSATRPSKVSPVTANHTASRMPSVFHQRLADEAARQDAPVDLGQAELRVLRRDREVAGDELGEAAAEAEAVHHRDGRLGIGEKLLPAPIVAGGARPRALDRLVVEIAEEQLEVLPRAPSVARPGQHQHLRLRIVLECVEDVTHLVM